jgi:hypothetical protein
MMSTSKSTSLTTEFHMPKMTAGSDVVALHGA